MKKISLILCIVMVLVAVAGLTGCKNKKIQKFLFDEDEYAVVRIMDGATVVSKQTVKIGDTANVPVGMEGCVYTDHTGATLFDFTQPIEKNTLLYYKAPPAPQESDAAQE